MNQQQLDQIKARALAALPDDSPPNMEKVRAMAEFRKHAANDVLELVAEVERFQASDESRNPTTVCLCGSTRFFEAFQKANLEETLAGRIVKPGEKFVNGWITGKKGVVTDDRTKWITDQTYAIQPGRGKASLGRFKLLDIRRERVRDISEQDALAEGVELNHYHCDEGTDLDPTPIHRCDPVGKFLELFESINGKTALDKEVWVLTFEVEQAKPAQ